MRVALSLAGSAVALVLLAAATLPAHAQDPGAPREPAPLDAGAPTFQRFTGTSLFQLKGACPDPTRCVGETKQESGHFFLAAMASDGHVEISWVAVNDSLAVLRVQVAGVEVEGPSPLRVDLPSLDPGEHAVRVAPARRVVGVHDQRVDWTATFHVSAYFRTLETRGMSSYETLSGCLLGTCAPFTRSYSDSFIAPWSGVGELAADWDPRDGPMELSISGTDFSIEGPPPLRMSLDGITAGEWRVELAPAGVLAPRHAEVGWLVNLVETNAS